MAQTDAQEANSTQLENTIVCVTGATGFVAGHIIFHLLELGYTVRGTVRSTASAAKQSHLLRWRDFFFSTSGSPRLHLVEADLLEPDTLVSAVRGCTYVIHAASPAIPRAADPFRDIIQPAIDGTRNVLEACRANKREGGPLRRVVLTSSVAALGEAHEDGSPLIEADWAALSADPHSDPYSYSKAHAEKLAADFVENLPPEEAFDLIALLPSVILGQQLQTESIGTSVAIVQRIVSGEYRSLGVPRVRFGWVDIHDVVVAHARAMTLSISPKRFDRFIVCAETADMPAVAEQLRPIFQDDPAIRDNIPTRIMPNWMLYAAAVIPGFEPLLTVTEVRRRLRAARLLNISGRKLVETLNAQSIPFEYTPIRVGLRDTVNSLVETGLIGGVKKKQGRGMVYLTFGAVAVGLAAYVAYRYSRSAAGTAVQLL